MILGSAPAARDATQVAAVGLPTALCLAAFAGAVDACGLTILKDIFVSFMSGNTTLMGAALADGDASRALLILSIIALFVVGAAAGAMLATVAGEQHVPVVLAAVAVVLAMPTAFPDVAVYAMAFAMGVLNAALDHAGSVKVSITYVTGTLVKVGQGLGRLLCCQPIGWGWLEQGISWLGLFGGAAAARASIHHFPDATLIALPIIMTGFAVSSWLISWAMAAPK